MRYARLFLICGINLICMVIAMSDITLSSKSSLCVVLIN